MKDFSSFLPKYSFTHRSVELRSFVRSRWIAGNALLGVGFVGFEYFFLRWSSGVGRCWFCSSSSSPSSEEWWICFNDVARFTSLIVVRRVSLKRDLCWCCCCSPLPREECRDKDFERLILPVMEFCTVVVDDRRLDWWSESSVVSLVNFSLSRNCREGL